MEPLRLSLFSIEREPGMHVMSGRLSIGHTLASETIEKVPYVLVSLVGGDVSGGLVLRFVCLRPAAACRRPRSSSSASTTPARPRCSTCSRTSILAPVFLCSCRHRQLMISSRVPAGIVNNGRPAVSSLCYAEVESARADAAPDVGGAEYRADISDIYISK
jgi:hypothetical protein